MSRYLLVSALMYVRQLILDHACQLPSALNSRHTGERLQCCIHAIKYELEFAYVHTSCVLDTAHQLLQ